MAEYLNGIPKANRAGNQVIKVVSGTGTATVQMQLDDEGFNNISDGFFDADTTVEITLPICDIQVLLTGTAKFYMKSST